MLDSASLSSLEHIGFSPSEARIYIAALELGSGGITDIAQLADINRATTYTIAEDLERNGYLHRVPGSKVLRYSATDPGHIATEREQAIQEFKEMAPYLRSKQRKAGKPSVSYYHGVEGVKQAFQRIYRPKEVRYATSIPNIKRHLPGEVERWRDRYVQGKARPGGHHLLTRTDEDQAYGTAIKSGGQLVRYLQDAHSIDMDLALLDGLVVLTAFDDDIHVTVIESPSLYRSLVSLYDLAWQNASEE